MAKRRTRIIPKALSRTKKVLSSSSASPITSPERDETTVSADSVVISQAKKSKGSRKGQSKPRTASVSTKSTRSRESNRVSKISKKDKNQSTYTSQRIRDLTVSKSAFSKWKPLSLPTKEYIKQILAATQVNIVGEILNDADKKQVQGSLDILQERIIEKMECIRGPVEHRQNYKNLETDSRTTEELLTSINSQLLTLEAELELQKNCLKSEEETEQHLQANTIPQLNQEDTTQEILSMELHNPTMKLNEEALNRPIPKIPSGLEKAAKKLTSILAKRKCEVDVSGFSSWAGSLSQLLSAVSQNHSV